MHMPCLSPPDDPRKAAAPCHYLIVAPASAGLASRESGRPKCSPEHISGLAKRFPASIWRATNVSLGGDDLLAGERAGRKRREQGLQRGCIQPEGLARISNTGVKNNDPSLIEPIAA
jgi:hypothetical protein